MDSTKIIPRFIILITLSGILILFDFLHLLSIPKKFVLTASTPIEFGLYSLYQSTRDKFSFFGFWRQGYKELAYLKQRNAELLVSSQLVEKLKQENEILKSQFAVSGGNNKSLLPVRVTGFNRFLFLDKGDKDGIKTGNAVILNNILIGRVVDVEEDRTRVILPVDPESKIAVMGLKNGARGILRGAYGFKIILEEVLPGETIEPEESVETYGGEYFDNGLLVAVVRKIIKEPNAAFQKAEAAPIVEYDKLRMVFVKIK